jgi:hypothetical protein
VRVRKVNSNGERDSAVLDFGITSQVRAVDVAQQDLGVNREAYIRLIVQAPAIPISLSQQRNDVVDHALRLLTHLGSGCSALALILVLNSFRITVAYTIASL